MLSAIRHAAVAATSFTASGLELAVSRRKTVQRQLAVSSRENEVLQLLHNGLSIPAIAAAMFISQSTAKTYVSRLYDKLGATNRTQALMTAMRYGLIHFDHDAARALTPTCCLSQQRRDRPDIGARANSDGCRTVETSSMTVIYLLRHGEADYEPVHERQWPGSMADLAPLTSRGTEQAEAAAGQLSDVGATLLVSSPFTRTMQTASIAACRIGLPVEVEFELHEWIPDEAFRWHTHAEVRDILAEFDRYGGEWPDGQRRSWEPLSTVRKRTSAALRRAVARAGNEGVLIAVCHEMVIRSLTGERVTPTGQFRKIESRQLT